MSFEVTPALEKKILVRCALDPDFRMKARPILQEYLFENKELVWIWKFIEQSPKKDIIEKNAFDLKAELEFGGDEDRLENYKLIIDEIFKQSLKSSEVSLELLEQSSNYVRVVSALERISRNVEEGQMDKAWEIIGNLRKYKNVDSNCLHLAENWEERQLSKINDKDSLKRFIPTRFKLLDKYIGGIQFGELGLISGSTGRGKSIAAVNIALASAIQGFPTVFFTTEMLSEQVANRFDSCVTGEKYEKFKRGDFTEVEFNELIRKFARRKKQLWNKLFIYDAPIRKCDLNFVEEKISELEERGIKVACIVIDSPDHFKSERRYDSKRHEYADIFWNLKAVSRGEGLIKRKMAVWATTQAPQEYERKIAGIRAVSESHDKARIADILITLNQTEIQEKNKEMVINLAKYRDGESKVMILVKILFDVMNFYEIGYYEDIVKKELMDDET